MHSSRALFSSLLILLFVPSALSQPGESPNRYTLQVAAFPEGEFSQDFIDDLKGAGENPAWGTVELPNRGRWIRVFVGSFKTLAEARRYGEKLIARRVIKEFIVRPVSNIKTLSRPRSVTGSETLFGYVARPVVSNSRPSGYKSRWVTSHGKEEREGKRAPAASTKLEPASPNRQPAKPLNAQQSSLQIYYASLQLSDGLRPDSHSPHAGAAESADPLLYLSLPPGASLDVALLPPVDTSLIPRPNPLLAALDMIAGGKRRPQGALQSGGLWITGDREDALARLRWIAGAENARAIEVDEAGRVRLNDSLLAASAGVAGESGPASALKALDYMASNEGLLLLIQLINGPHRYGLHIGPSAPTAGGEVAVSGSINLDNNFASRINPYRRLRKKLDQERPPEGLDCLIGINPTARWFNLRIGRLVPAGNITFHELTEAHAKVEMGLDYLGQGALLGAHAIALEREKRLKAQRPFADVVVTVGSNRVLRTEKEFRQFSLEASGKGQK
jgi:hypothetical protein